VGAGTSLPGHVVPHTPLLQTWPEGHALPQAPQLSALVSRRTHRPSHSVCPAGHEPTQEPPTHTWPEEQTVPQVPQLSGLVSNVAQASVHSVRPTAQELVLGKSTYFGSPPASAEDFGELEQASERSANGKARRSAFMMGFLHASPVGPHGKARTP
jgi:hypothetical protein